MAVGIETGDTRKRDEDRGEFHPAGRDGDPVFVRDWIGDVVTYNLAVNSQQERQMLERLVRSVTSLLLQWPEGGREYLRITDDGTSTYWTGVHQMQITAHRTLAPA